MKTVRTMPATHTSRSRVTIKRIKATHRVPRSNPAELGYTSQQREQLRAIKAEMSHQFNTKKDL